MTCSTSSVPARTSDAGDRATDRTSDQNGLVRFLVRLRDDERGEGVISAAIAVLIMAFIGVAAFAAYKSIMGDVTQKTQDCVSAYVTDAAECGNG
jgi:hypothetical protein